MKIKKTGLCIKISLSLSRSLSKNKNLTKELWERNGEEGYFVKRMLSKGNRNLRVDIWETFWKHPRDDEVGGREKKKKTRSAMRTTTDISSRLVSSFFIDADLSFEEGNGRLLLEDWNAIPHSTRRLSFRHTWDHFTALSLYQGPDERLARVCALVQRAGAESEAAL